MNPRYPPSLPPTPEESAVGADSPDELAAALASTIVSEQEQSALVLRVRQALGQDDSRAAAARLGMSYTVVRRVVAGKRPTIDFLRRLCRVYRVDGHWLLTGEGTPSLDDRAAEALRSVPSEVLTAEFTRRLARVLSAAELPPMEAALRRGQAALDDLRSELPQAP